MDDGLRELELGVVDRSPTATNGRIGSGNPNAVDLDTALDCTNTEGDFVLCLFAYLSYRLGLEHLRRLRAFALVDLAVLAEPVLVEGDLDKTNQYSQDYSACENLGKHVSGCRKEVCWVTHKSHLLP